MTYYNMKKATTPTGKLYPACSSHLSHTFPLTHRAHQALPLSTHLYIEYPKNSAIEKKKHPVENAKMFYKSTG